ncbi:MAG: MqnA/MqnD/SBP family protein [Planctomycetota bacterium]
MNADGAIHLTIGHSPDADDAFMWWPLGDAGAGEPAEIDCEGFVFTPIAEDIEALNRRAQEAGDLDVTAMSFAAWARVADRYALTSSGASMGTGFGPKIVSAKPMATHTLRDATTRFAIPGVRTSAYLTLRLLLGRDPLHEAMGFDRVIPAVLAGEADAGLVIHEAQVTFADDGLHLVEDLGVWWARETGLPLPLGANAIRRDLDERFGGGTSERLSRVLRRSIEHAMGNRERSLDVAQRFAPEQSRESIDRFVALYVNDLTVDMGERGSAAVRRLLEEAAGAGLLPRVASPEPVVG